MAMNVEKKKKMGRPSEGMNHTARVPMKQGTWEAFQRLCQDQGTHPAAAIRAMIEDRLTKAMLT